MRYEKNGLWLFRIYYAIPMQFYGNYFINHEIRIPTRMTQWKVPEFFFPDSHGSMYGMVYKYVLQVQ